MRRCLLLIALGIEFLLVGSAAGQAALDRLEQQVRGRSGGAMEDDTGYLGLVADDRLDSGRGVRIVQIIPDSPAQAAGLKTGDLITAVAAKPVRSMEDLARLLRPAKIGARLMFEFKRDRRTQQLEVTLGRRPPEEERPFEDFGEIPDNVRPQASSVIPRAGVLGVRVEQVSPELQAELNLPSTDGALIVHVNPGSPGALARLPLQGVIVAVDDSAVRTTADLKRLIAAAGAGAKVRISYYAQGHLHEREVRLAASLPPAAVPPGPWRLPADMSDEAPIDSETETRIGQLEQQVRQLEQRVAELERLLESNVQDANPQAEDR